MSVREYIGARYVPLIMGDWDNTKTYEPLSVVLYQGNSYTSRQYVPTGIEITNDEYWASTGNYNAQVEAYRQEVQSKVSQSEYDTEIASIENRLTSRENMINANVVSTGTMQKVWECVKSYLHNMDNLVYHTYGQDDDIPGTRGHNAWSYDTGPDEVSEREPSTKSGYAINCSSFLHLILTGVPYEASMYNRNNGNVNAFGKAGYCFNMYGEAVNADNFDDYLFVRNLAPRLDELGLVEYCANDYSNVRTGDVLIFSNQDEKTLDTATHVGIVLASYYSNYLSGSARGQFIVAECYDDLNCIRIAPITDANLVSRGVFATAHIPYQECAISQNKKIADFAYVNANARIKPNNMVVGDIVTVDFDWTSKSVAEPDKEFVSMTVNGESTLSANPLRYMTVPENAGYYEQKRHYTVVMDTMYSGCENNTPITEILFSPKSGIIENLKVYNGYGAIGDWDSCVVETVAELESYLETFAQVNSFRNVGNARFAVRNTSAIELDGDTVSTGNMLCEVTYMAYSTTVWIDATLKCYNHETYSLTYNGTAWTIAKL